MLGVIPIGLALGLLFFCSFVDVLVQMGSLFDSAVSSHRFFTLVSVSSLASFLPSCPEILAYHFATHGSHRARFNGQL